MKRASLFVVLALLTAISAIAQPEVPVEQWTGKTILLVGGPCAFRVLTWRNSC